MKGALAQDLVEYTLLLGMVALVVLGLVIAMGQATSGVWTVASNVLGCASPGACQPVTPPAPPPPDPDDDAPWR